MTRDAEHTPSPQSVVVPVELVRFLLGEGSFDGRDFGDERTKTGGKLARYWWRKPLRKYLYAAPAPSSLAGGEVDLHALGFWEMEIGRLADGAKGVDEFTAVEWSDLKRVLTQCLAALSPEAPALENPDEPCAPENARDWPSPEAPAREATAFAMNDGMTTHPTLRSANIARQNEWDQDNQISAAYRGNELAGEVGEACNVIKKLERERLGILGSRATVGELADELADVLICADLVAMHYGIDLEAAVARKFNATSEKVGLQTRLAAPNDGGGS
jgi:NTP pyrophosphatase (non-canonical NTP hydrolase)